MKKISILFTSVLTISFVMVGCVIKTKSNKSVEDITNNQDTLTTITMTEEIEAPGADEVEGISDAAAIETEAIEAPAEATEISKYWYGDMPTALNILEEHIDLSDQYYKKGYREVGAGEATDWTLSKDGVCTIEYSAGMGAESWTITVFDTSKLNWLYQDLKKATAHDKLYEVNLDSNIIAFYHDYGKHMYDF